MGGRCRALALAGLLLVLGCGGAEESDPQVLAAGQLDIRLPPGWKVTDGGAERPARAQADDGGTAAGADAAGSDVPLAEKDPQTAFFEAGQAFQQCLKDTGTEFRGAPDQSDPDSPTNDPAYVQDLSTCASKSGIVQAMSEMQKAQAELTPEEIEEQNKGFLRWRKCMIGKGWEISEPKPDSKGRLFSFGGGGGGVEITPPNGEDLMSSEDMAACTEDAG